jgi:xylitol oxidase
VTSTHRGRGEGPPDTPTWSERNWSGNIRYAARAVHRPQSIGELRRIVAGAPRVRALGTRHTFNRIADASSDGDGPGELIVLDRLPLDIDIDTARGRATVPAAIRYGDLAIRLDRAGYALPAMASLPHISVAGSIATGTHGSGDHNGTLAATVVAIELVTAAGDILTLSRESDGATFAGAVVGLGALGVVTRVTLDIEPTYAVAQWVYEGMAWDQLSDHIDEVFASAYSVSVLTRWDVPAADYVLRKHRIDDGYRPAPAHWLETPLATVDRHPVVGMPPEPATPQRGVPGPWYARLPHFRLDFTPSVGAELQSEYFVPREHAVAVIAALRAIAARLAPVLLVSELRTIAGDDLWLSPAYGRDTLAIHFTWADDQAAVERVLPAVEAALAPYAPRAHWGKVFTMTPAAVAAGFGRHADFGRLRHRLDPDGTFGNAFVDTYAPAIDDATG